MKICDGSIKIAGTVTPSSNLRGDIEETVQNINYRNCPVAANNEDYFKFATKSFIVPESIAGAPTIHIEELKANKSLKLPTNSDVVINTKEIQNNVTDSPLLEISCPACSNGDLPGGAHKCRICKKSVHALPSCSIADENEEEGYGQNRTCKECYKKNPVKGKKIKDVSKNKPSKLDKMASNGQMMLKTSIVDRLDLTSDYQSEETEITSLEGWKGLSLPPKKRLPGYYWKTHPDFPMQLNSSRMTQIGILKNGMDPSLKVTRVGKYIVALSNTCSFDGICQILATAYKDSLSYKDAIDRSNVVNSVLEVGKYIANNGVKQAAYKKRATVLATFIKNHTLKGGMLKVNCAMDCSSMIRQMKILPSVTEKYNCSSPHCPKPPTERHLPIIPAMFNENVTLCFKNLSALLNEGDVEDTNSCLLVMADISGVPPEFYIKDSAISTKVNFTCYVM